MVTDYGSITQNLTYVGLEGQILGSKIVRSLPCVYKIHKVKIYITHNNKDIKTWQNLKLLESKTVL